MSIRLPFITLVLSLCLNLSSLFAANAQASVEAFYRGKNLQLIIGSNVGGGYDFYGRLVGRYIGKYIPGKPNVVVSNMAGAGGNTAPPMSMRLRLAMAQSLPHPHQARFSTP